MLHNFATSFLNYGLAASGPILQDVVTADKKATLNMQSRNNDRHLSQRQFEKPAQRFNHAARNNAAMSA